MFKGVWIERTYSSELLNILRPSRTEHEGLTVWSNLADDFADLRLETHVEHTISLVQNKVRHTAKVGLLRLEHINETAGRSDDDLNASLKIANLRAFWGTAVDGSVTDAGVGAIERASIRHGNDPLMTR